MVSLRPPTFSLAKTNSAVAPPKNNPAPKKGTKEGAPWVPRPGGGPARAGPSTTANFDPYGQGSAAPKRKSSANTAGSPPSNRRQKGGASRLTAALEELALFKEDSTRPICSKDKPVTVKNRANKSVIILRPVNNTWSDGDTEKNKMIDNVMVNFDLSCQTPQLRIGMDGYTLELHAHNFLLNEVDPTTVVQDRIFKNCDFNGKRFDQSLDGIKNGFANELNIPDLTDNHAMGLLAFGGADSKPIGNRTDKHAGSFYAINFTVKGRVSPPRVTPNYPAGKVQDETKALKFQRLFKKGNINFTLVRRYGNFSYEVDAYWKHRLRVFAQQGLWPIYNGYIGPKFKAWYKNPTKFLPHEPWMAEGPAKKDEIQRYAAYEARSNFGSMAEWEIVLSAAVVHEVETMAKLNKRYYDWGRDREAFVKHDLPPINIDKRTRFLVRPGLPTTAKAPSSEIKINEEETGDGEKPEELGDEVKGEGPAEKVKVETDVKVINDSDDDEYSWENDALNPANISCQVICESFERYQRNALATDMMEDAKSTSYASIVKDDYTHRPMDKPAYIMNADVKHEAVSENVARKTFVTQNVIEMVYTARVLETENNHHFVIAFTMPKDKRMVLHEGGTVKVQLKVADKFPSQRRQLKAIGMIAEKRPKDDIYGQILQRVILGEGMTDLKGGCFGAFINHDWRKGVWK
ncbi:hypothetical protein EAF04_008232 [Stromatinia cepivora]|nr:hypothetical protein EAF04_008232 [Stromatinia cepivora]